MLIRYYKDIKDINRILKVHPEESLAYLCSQHFEVLKKIVQTNRHYKYLIPHLLRFSLSLLRQWRPFYSLKDQNTHFFIFSSAINQMRALDTTISSLQIKKHRFFAVCLKNLLKNQSDKKTYSGLYFNTADIIKTLIVASYHTPSLYQKVKQENPTAARSYYFEYLWTYAYLVYFHRILKDLKPEFVLTANDLNPSNRAMLAVAEYLSIKTVYMQHASVTDIFPALSVDLAFLDGQYALDIYRRCEVAHKNNPASKTKVLLSGQKKPIVKSKDTSNTVGLAINALDDIQSITKLVEALIDYKYKVIVRWHPTQPMQDIDKILALSSKSSSIEFSDPAEDKVDSFLVQISHLIAGNSSIHLEAALAGINPIYFEFIKQKTPDYYNYVKNGLAQKANSITDIINIVRSKTKNNEDATKYYSSTYKTEWEGHEGELVVKCLEAILESRQLPISAVSL